MVITPGNGLGCVLSIVSMPSAGSTVTAEDRLLAKYWPRFSLLLGLVLAQAVSSSGCSSG